MHDRQGRLLRPDQFIPAAEADGSIVALGEWVALHALAQVDAWKRDLDPQRPFCVGINVSPRQFDEPDAITRLRRLIADSPVRSDAVVLEVTEGIQLADTASVRHGMECLHEIGTHLAVDDFGTGFASTRYLLTLPFSQIKIDRSYVSVLPGSDRSAAIARGLLQMAVTSGLHVVAEGIETHQQRRIAVELGCQLGQGYLFNRALPAAAIDRLLRATPPVPRPPEPFACGPGRDRSLSTRGNPA